MLQDLRYAARWLRRSPGFTAVAVLSLAVGIGFNTALFSVLDAILFRPLPVAAPDRLVDVYTSGSDGDTYATSSYPDLLDLQARNSVFADMMGYSAMMAAINLPDRSRLALGEVVTGNYFQVLGVGAAVGRTLLPEDDRPGAERVAMISHRAWTRDYASSPQAVGQSVRMRGQAYTIVGVTPAGFSGMLPVLAPELWITTAHVGEVEPAGIQDVVPGPGTTRLDRRGQRWLFVKGRLRDGVTAGEARANVELVWSQLVAAHPQTNKDRALTVVPTRDVRIHPDADRALLPAGVGLMVAFGLVLAIACANVASMLLARATVRRREIATRLAVGASRGRIITQLLTETAVLFFAAALAALPLTVWLMALLVGLLPSLPVPIGLDLGFNPRVALFAIGVSLAASLLFGLAPARQALRGNVVSNLYGAHGTADRRRFRLRNTLVVTQVALSLMLVVTAFMFLRTLQNAGAADPGFETRNITLVNVDVGLAGYREQAAVDLVERFRARLADLGGVEAVATGRMIPLQGSSLGLGRIRVPGYVDPTGEETVRADWNIVSPGYFETVRMPIVDGRGFAASDRDGAMMVAVVNETFARTAWPGRSAVGQRFMQRVFDGKERPIEIVGVAADAKYRYISEDPTPFVFVPLAQQPMADTTFFIRHVEGRPIVRDARAALAQLEPGVPVLFAQSFEEAVGIGLLPQRVAAWVAGGVGTAGIFLAALGLYGLMAFLVAQRSREIAIRVALGASSGDMQAMVLKQAARLGIYGGLAGLALAAGVGTLTRSMLVGVPAVDPVSFGVTTILFVGVLAAAAWIPARRASSMDPASALRAE
jgi:macrolide transport system ATP-binding/permease protein